MKKKNLLLLLILIFSILGVAQNSKKDYNIIPYPNKLVAMDGEFVINSNTQIYCDDILKNEADYLSALTSSFVGSKLNNVENISLSTIKLTLNKNISNNEGYKLVVNSNGIEIVGKTSTGVFYSIQTLRQLIRINKSGQISVPAVVISDCPKFAYRGMHLDVGRHFFSTDEIKKYIDLIALHKMNTFHWHLTEDQGWRIEIKRYPKLTEIGAWRKETMVGHMRSNNQKNLKYDGKRYGGFYTQEEIKDIVKYAQTRHVNIIPEIDLPGHSVAALAAYPQYGNTGDTLEVGTKWGVYNQIYSPKEETFVFLENILAEVMDLFPSEYIHIGGDESPKDEWEESEFAQQLMKEKGLKNEHELQGYFIKRISKFVESKGKKVIGWDEITEGGLAENATVMFWQSSRGSSLVNKIADDGNDVIMTPTKYCYFDAYQVKGWWKKRKEKLAIGGYISVEKVYDFNPLDGISEENKKHILGGQGNVWTEYIKTYDQVEYMAVPRMTALSEVLWSSDGNKNWKSFKHRLQHMTKVYDHLCINYAKHYTE
jgi:hexosaminidase